MEEIKGLIPLNLQFFADAADGEGAGGEEDPAKGTPEPHDSEDDGAKELDLNAMLAGDKGLQSQFDKLVGKALATHKSKWEKEKGMTAEQLAEARTQEKVQALGEKDRELAQREQALYAKELRADALEALGKKGLPPTLIDCVSLMDAASMQTSVTNAEKAFRAAVDAAVKEKMKGYAPSALGGDQTASHLAKFEAAIGLKPKKE